MDKYLKRINSKGFSLIEGIVTIVIIGIITVPITMIFLGALNNTEEAKQKLKATQLAQMYIESMKARDEGELMGIFYEDSDGDGNMEAIEADSEGEVIKVITSEDGENNGFNQIPQKYKAVLSYNKSAFDLPEYQINNHSEEISYDARIIFESGMDKSFLIQNADGDEDIFTQQIIQQDRVIVITYQYDNGSVLIQDNSQGTLTSFYAEDLNPLTINKQYYNVMINCRDTSELTDAYNTRVYVVNQTSTPVNVFVYQNINSTVLLSVNDVNGPREGKVQTYYSMNEKVDATHKIYEIGVKILDENDNLLSQIRTTKAVK